MRKLFLNLLPYFVAAAAMLGLNLAYAVPAGVAIASFAVIGFALLVRGSGEAEDAGISPAAARAEIGPALGFGIVEALPEPAMLLNAADIVVELNAPAREAFGGLKPGQHASGATRSPELFDLLRRCREGDGLIVTAIVERVPVERHFTVTAARVAGGPAVLMTFRDLTDVERVARMRTDFVTNASHELRTPLASLLGFIETLQGPAKDDPRARERFLGIMAAQGLRMKRLNDDLLSLSRIEMRQHVRPTETVDLSEILQDVHDSFEPIATASKATLMFERPNGEAWMLGDRDELAQLFGNLLQNAIKYGRDGGTVTLRLMRPDPQKLLVEVTDDGPGIDPVHLPRLTERFYRVDAASSREKGGTGLGLAIVKHIVNRHRGELTIRSTIGEGSTFAVSFDPL